MTTEDALIQFLEGVFEPGDVIRIEDSHGDGISSADPDVIIDYCLEAEADDPWIDLVTEAGKVRGLYLPGDPAVVEPSPSFVLDDGMIYLLVQNMPLEGEPHGKHMLPLSAIATTPDPLTYEPGELTVSTPGSEIDITLSQGRNRSEYQGKWKPVKSVFGQFSDALQNHKEGPKDGPCFLQGECAGGTRKAAAMIANYIIGVDLDSGAPLDDVMESIIYAGLEAVIYTTHSHLKTTSQIKRDYFLKWSEGDEPTPELCAEFLQNRRGVVPEILDGLVILDDAQHTEEGVVILVQHKPMPKFRAVFPLSEPFVFAKRGGTQQDAIAEWKERYAGFATAMTFFFDETCVDPARLFYLPRHKKGDVHGAWWIAGKPVDLDNYDRLKVKRDRKSNRRATAGNAFTDLAGGTDEEDDANRYMVNDFNLLSWAKTASKKFEIESMITDLAPDMVREPRTGKPGTHVECPFEGDHSSLGGGGTFVVNSSDNYDDGYDGGFTFTCVHNSCYGRDRLDFIKGCIEEEWFTVADLKSKSYLMELEEDEEEEEEPKAVEESKPARSQNSKSAKYEEAVDVEDDETRKLNDLNRRYAVVINGSAVKILREPLLEGEEDDVAFFNQSDVALFERNNLFFIQGKGGKTEAMESFKAWLAWEKRRTFHGVTFSPGNTHNPAIYNLFRGYSVDPIKGDWSILRNHIYENICESDDGLFDWFMTWMAHLIQHPDKKPGSTIVVLGNKGTGKSTTFEYLSKLIAHHAISVNQREQIIGKFNSHISSTLLMVCEEAFWAADPQAEGVLKDLITNPYAMIEKKGYDPVKTLSFIRLAMVTNNDWAVPASLDERRFGVFKCSDKRRGDTEFFDALRHQMDNLGGTEAMMYELLHYLPMDGSFSCLYNPPKTTHLQKQQVETLHGVDKFMLSLMHTGTYEPTNENIDAVELNDDKPTLIYAVTLRSCVEDFMRMRFQSEKAKTSYDDVASAAKSWFDAEDFMLDVEGGMNRKRTIRFPPLAEAREKLKERKGIEIEFLARETVESKGKW